MSIEFPSQADAAALATADDLPARLADELRAALAQSGRAPLRSAHPMSPELSYGRHAGPPPVTARAAAVMLLLFRSDGRWHLPLTQRPAALARHGGQISLPGGRIEPGETAAEAAMRELSEELGVRGDLQPIGRLPDRYVYASDYVVTPRLAATHARPRWIADPNEVERVVEFPLEALLAPSTVGRMTIHRGPLVFHAPCYVHGQDRVWGATAVILSELAALLHRLYPVP